VIYNPEIHHRKSIRLKGYDYSKNGIYFITICTHNRENLFGEIIDGKMIINDAGKMVEKEILKTNEIRENIKIEEYIIMPNHIHFVIEIVGAMPLERPNITSNNEHNNKTKTEEKIFHQGSNTMQSNTIGSIVNHIKSKVTKWCRQNSNIDNAWQRNYYENIIRNEEIYQRVSEYIKNNPQNWTDDKYYK
jgi:REP element-mobilizing transposase RayT